MCTRFRQFAAFAVACGAFSIVAPPARAQVLGQQRTVNLPAFKSTGEFVGMSGNYMKCVLDGQPVYVQFDQQSKVKVTGTATVDFLAPKMYVQFKGTFDRHGKGAEPIKEFTIFTPDSNNPIGAVEAGGGSAFEEPAAKKKGPQPATTDYAISGQITSMHNGLMFVNCGKMKVKAEIAPDATVKLDSSDPSWASSGDKVSIDGGKIAPGRVLGRDVTIELARPLEAKKKTHAYHATDKTTTATDKSTDKTTDKSTDKSTDKATGKPADKSTDKGAADKGATDKGATDKGATDKSTDAKKPADGGDAFGK